MVLHILKGQLKIIKLLFLLQTLYLLGKFEFISTKLDASKYDNEKNYAI